MFPGKIKRFPAFLRKIKNKSKTGSLKKRNGPEPKDPGP